MELLKILYGTTGISMITGRQLIMIIISLILLYLAIKKQYEPYLLLPISFGMLLANLPAVANEGLMEKGGLLFVSRSKIGNLSAINISGDRSKY